MGRIFLIDDDKKICDYISLILKQPGHTVEYALSIEEGVDKCNQQEFDLVLLDLHFPSGNGLEALPHIQNSSGRPEVIIITGAGDPDGAELAITTGAWDYIEKPFKIDPLLLAVKRALLYHKEKQTASIHDSFKRKEIIGNSSQLAESLLQAARAAESGSNTLLIGETGTGKELFARAIHQNSLRREFEFVAVDCASLPKELIESILFGHVKGAFTGADKDRKGLVQLAHRGTLFLDEVGELPISSQKSFLRVLQERRVRPVGGKKEEEIDFSIISATNCNLDELVKQEKFRTDLLFRLQTFQIELPPLRKRKDDIPHIFNHHLQKLCESNQMSRKIFSDEFLEAIDLYDWPGNVRELINVVENAFAAGKSSPVLFPEHLPVTLRAKIIRYTIKGKEKVVKQESVSPQAKIKLTSYKKYRESIVHQAEKPYLEQLLEATRGNIDEACAISELSRSRFYALLKKHDVSKTNLWELS